MKNKWVKILSTVMACGMLLSATACGGTDSSSAGIQLDVPTGGNPDAAQTLDIYLLYKGYGDAWLKETINNFAKQTWVRDKYPEFSVNYTFDAVDATASQKLTAGAAINKYDLIFGVNLQGSENSGLLADLTDSVFLTDVPGETGKKVIDKVPQMFLNRIRNAKAEPRADGNDTYMVVPYFKGYFGMLYNADLLTQMQLDLPLTTDQFLEVAAQIKTKKYSSAVGNNLTDVINNNAGDNYWRSAYDIWWSQYEGIEGVENFYEGYDEAEEMYGSVKVLDQKGRKTSLEVIEDILTQYSYSKANDGNFKSAQTAFLMGDGVFHFNGDYFATEMQTEINTLKTNNNISYDIRYMKMPVISSIIERTPTIQSDAALRAVVQEIDENKAWADSTAKTNGVSKADYAIITEARGISGSSVAGGHAAVVPSYAAGKAVAADFLRYMYTDEAIKNFTKASGGIMFPSTYDILNDAEVMEYVQPIHKSKMINMQGTSNCPFVYMVSAASTTLGKGGLESLYYPGKFEVNFQLDEEDRQSAADILKAEKDHWNVSTWNQMVAASGS